MEKFLALSEEKQTAVRNAALSCFAKHGYDKASINDIAIAAGISKASMFQYFGSKQALYQLKSDRAKALEEAETALNEARMEDHAAKMAQVEEFNSKIAAVEKTLAELERFRAPEPETAGVPHPEQELVQFPSPADLFHCLNSQQSQHIHFSCHIGNVRKGCFIARFLKNISFLLYGLFSRKARKNPAVPEYI